MSTTNQLIAVAGEALVDLVLELDGRATSRAGGGSFNTARTLGRLGLRPVFVGRISSDASGHALRAELAQSGVRLDGIVITDDPTTFAGVEIDQQGTARYRFYADGTSSPGLMPDEARAALPPSAAALHVGGLGLVFQPQAAAIAGLVREAPDTLVVLDPNCRPGAVRDPIAYRERLHEVLARADVVKASEEDLVYLEPDHEPLDTAHRLLQRGPAVVLLTHGSRGATVLGPGREAIIPAQPAQVIDTIGAGDAFGAAWLASWIGEGLGRAELEDFDAAVRAAEFAAMVAARTCERAGADPPTAVELDGEWCFAS
jgi:fructokinase